MGNPTIQIRAPKRVIEQHRRWHKIVRAQGEPYWRWLERVEGEALDRHEARERKRRQRAQRERG